MSPGPATLEKEVADPVEGTEKRTELASRLETITLRSIFMRRTSRHRYSLVTCWEAERSEP